FDILGPAISMLEEVTEEAPYLEPGRWRLVDSNYYRRIEALEFAVKHDDGRSVHDIKKADLVLIGISRTSKTPLSIYLALRGLRVANVPLVLGLEPPREIFDISHKKMIGLTIEAQALAEIRSRRIEVLQGKNNGYMKMSSILNEIEQAEATMRKIGCRIINVTHKAVEEIASEILRYKSNL
ncbi:MAG: kinase/pyrophosphorylase, partial [Candidatus Subteraquimicrobiales bacterium]|nr:kinase/pyrophosphorylase [Candidatus Subteraquimicrobiales bacterium]